MLSGSGPSSPATAPSDAGSWAKKTSAGLSSPSSSSVAASWGLLAYFTSTLTPDSSRYRSMIGPTSDSLRPE